MILKGRLHNHRARHILAASLSIRTRRHWRKKGVA